MTELFALLVALFSYLGPVQIAVVDAPSVTARAIDGHAYESAAKATACIDGVSGVVMTRAVAGDARVLVHELLHVADCRDNGVYDGSLDPTNCAVVRHDCAHSWVLWALRHPETATRQLESMGD